MIFVSVGSFLPFDRLVQAVDEWAGNNPDDEIFVQIGGGTYEPRHAPFARMIVGTEYRARLQACDLFVAHVGMGSILQALEMQKQMLMLPRLASRGEHTTDHQLDTARRFNGRQGMLIVSDTDALKASITRLLREPLETGCALPSKASSELISAVAAFLHGGTL